MKKIIKISDILLFSIAGIIDIFEQIKDTGGLFTNYYQNLYGFVPNNWKRQNLTKLLSECYKKNLIKKNKVGKKASFNLTSLGNNHIYKRFPQLFWKKENWSGKWFLVFFDIQEINRRLRDILRATLRQTGFLMIQKSVWISPSFKSSLLINKWITQNKIYQKVIVIEADKIPSSHERQLIEKFWNLEDLDKKIGMLFSNFKNISNRLSREPRIKNEFDISYLKLIKLSIGIPSLPRRFYPVNWHYHQTWELAKELKKHFVNKQTITVKL